MSKNEHKSWETIRFIYRKDHCENCGLSEQDHEKRTGMFLHIHHKDGNPFNNDPINLQTLCIFCHNKIPRYSKWLFLKQ